jgi:hypothetical protein
LCLCLINLSSTPWRSMRSGGTASPFLTSALDEGEWPASRPCRFTPGIHCIRDWVDPRAGLDAMEYKKTTAPTGNRIPVKTIARRYTDWAIAAPRI